MVDARILLEGTGTEILADTAGNWLMEDATVEVDRDPHVELQKPVVSHLAIPEEAEDLTLLPSHHTSPQRLRGRSAWQLSAQGCWQTHSQKTTRTGRYRTTRYSQTRPRSRRLIFKGHPPEQI